ncbi:ABC transporter substrate-binding protein [Thermoflavimicrobium dichotomicum]|uniref:Branched-chain amino acid transport system substrate-binding protein n=1 Tax=Thermoflavimicrobium dichotomicum TaxID=46223 RepID=A0A1I3SAY2_9BACL|nr:ABC transporter substrate-binding protein [Thermoflavimicrobium dichotomicum]SFJ55132.1 branched-chain amino acid transport system substrate-binding protein [Thermoflavimicrobium dichotomicum]
MFGKRFTRLCLAILLATSFMAGCSSMASEEDTLRVGVAFPVSGSLAKIGQACTNGIEIAKDIVNERPHAKKIELVKVDIPDVTSAVNEVNRLITMENVKTIVGAYGSPLAMAASEITERNKVILWEVAATDPRLTGRGYRYVFRPNPNASSYGPASIEFLEKVVSPKLGKKPSQLRIALLHEDGDFGHGVSKATRKAAQKAGMPIIGELKYNAKTTNDMTSIILQLKKWNPDVLDVVQYNNDAQLFLKQAKQLGYVPKVIIANGAGQSTDNFGDAFGKDADGVLDTSSAMLLNTHALTPEARQINEEFFKRFQKKFGKKPDLIAKVAFSSAYILFNEVLQKTGTTDPEKVRQQALSLDLPIGSTPVGWGIHFDQNGQNTRAQMTVMQWQNGKLLAVYPEKFALTKPIYIPLPKWNERK